MKSLSCFLFFVSLCLMGGDRHKKDPTDTISQKCWSIFCNLEKGLMGEKDLAKAEKLLAKAEGVDRAWLAACIGQYHRTQCKQPIDGIKILLNECLGDRAAKDWVRKLKTAENARLARWRDQVRANRMKRLSPPLKPTGLALNLPPIDHLKITPENVPATLELSRCLGELGEIHTAIRVIDKCGSSLQNDELCLLLSYEALADLNRMNHDLERAAKGYGTALKIFGSVAKRKRSYGEGFSKWESSARARIKQKLAEVKRLIEADRFGQGWVDYRDAEKVRLKDNDYVRALLMYDAIMTDHPKTVYESAARCYSIKCLLELAARKRPRRREDTRLDALNKTLADEKAFLRLAKRCKVPAAGLDEIKERIRAIEDNRLVLESIPYGETAHEKAKERAREATKNVWGLYVGEILFDLGMFELERQLDPKASEPYFKQASTWFDKVQKMNSALASYRIPSKALEVSRPPENERVKDAWGNIEKVKPKVGDIFNRKSSSWYWRHYRKEVALYSGLIAYMKRDFELARTEWNTLVKVDRFFLDCEKEGRGSSWKRLIWNLDHNDGCLYATPKEMKAFRSKKRRLLVYLADLAYETEKHANALSIYDALLSGKYGRLTREERGYVIFAKFACYGWLKGPAESLRYLKTNVKYTRNTPSEPRVLFGLASRTLSGGTRNDRYDCLEYLELLRRHCGNSDEAKKSYFISGWIYANCGDHAKAVGLLATYIERVKGPYSSAANLLLQELNKKETQHETHP